MLRRLSNQAVQVGQRIGCTQIQPVRRECILRRMYPPRQRKEGEKRSLKRREYVYILEENTTTRAAGNIDLILTADIEELGQEGEMVTVSKRIGWNHLLPYGLGVYTSPENLAKYHKKSAEKVKKQTQTGQRTVRQLAAMTLPVPMNPESSWVLDKKHVRIALRRVGVYIEEHQLTLPSHPVTEFGEMQIRVKVNGIDDVSINCLVVAYNAESEYEPDVEVWQDTTVNLVEHIGEAYRRLVARQIQEGTSGETDTQTTHLQGQGGSSGSQENVAT